MALLIAGTHSGVGKTTVTLAVAAALRQRGLRVAPFKLGPDFLDPTHLAAAAGRPCGNLDLWMLGEDYIRARLAAAEAEADFVLIEAMMGLHDGRGGLSADGSAAEFARRFQVPTLLVVDASAMARSLAALVKGFREFDPQVPLAGILANRVGGPGHVRYLEEALSGEPLPLLGALPADARWHIPERHLGLTMAGEGSIAMNWSDLAVWAEQNINLDRLLALGQAKASPTTDTATLLPSLKNRLLADCAPSAGSSLAGCALEISYSRSTTPNPESPPPTGNEDWKRAAGYGKLPTANSPRARLGIARDAAFGFYYEDNLRLLAAAGAELVEFSPLADPHLPPGLDGLYLGGGYPELHAERFEANLSMRSELRDFARAGKLIYAECGGMMALARSLTLVDGRCFQMAGVLPIDVRMCARLRALGYREVAPLGLGPPASELRLRGHEFHYSEILDADAAAAAPGLPPAWRITYPENPASRSPAASADSMVYSGYRLGAVRAGYIHLHFASCPAFARLLVGQMGKVRMCNQFISD